MPRQYSSGHRGGVLRACLDQEEEIPGSPPGGRCSAGNLEVVDRFLETDLLEKGLDPESVSIHVVLGLKRSLTAFQANIEAFELFCECLNFAAMASDRAPEPLESLAHIVKTKAGLATFYDAIAQMAPLAGVEDLDQEVTAREKAEAIAERDDLLAKIAAASEAQDDSE